MEVISVENICFCDKEELQEAGGHKSFDHISVETANHRASVSGGGSLEKSMF